MGRPKALLPLAPGSKTSFLERVIQLTQGLSSKRIIVSSLPKHQLSTTLPVVAQNRPEDGQLSSLLMGWREFGEGAPWVMSCLVDHPYVEKESLQSLMKATKIAPEASMWSLSHKKKGGHPVVFSSQLMKQLEATPLHLGARPVVRKLGSKRFWVEVEDPAILWDTDTPEDYEIHSQLWQAREQKKSI